MRRGPGHSDQPVFQKQDALLERPLAISNECIRALELQFASDHGGIIARVTDVDRFQGHARTAKESGWLISKTITKHGAKSCAAKSSA